MKLLCFSFSFQIFTDQDSDIQRIQKRKVLEMEKINNLKLYI